MAPMRRISMLSNITMMAFPAISAVLTAVTFRRVSATQAAMKKASTLRPCAVKEIPLSDVYPLVERPIVPLTTRPQARANVMAHDGRIYAAVGDVCGRPRRFSFAALRATREGVIAVPTAELAP